MWGLPFTIRTMVRSVRPLIFGSAVLITATLGSGCDRLRSLAKNLKKSGDAKPATTATSGSGQVTAIDGSNYEAFIAQPNKLVIVDFYADWCGPCRLLSPMLEKAAAAHPAVVFIGKVNVDQAPQLATQQQVSGIPDVRIFKDGRQIDRFVGCPSEPEVLAKIASLAQGITAAPATPAAPAAPAKTFEESVQPMPKDWLPPGLEKR